MCERFTRHSTRNGFYCLPFIKSGYFTQASVLDEAIKARACSRYNLFAVKLRKVTRPLFGATFIKNLIAFTPR